MRPSMMSYKKCNQKMEHDTTLNYYESHAEEFFDSTRFVDFHETQEHFLEKLPASGKILDFGCGAGRDTKCFMERGFNVDAVDGSEKLCELASEYTGIKVRRMLFQELDAIEVYDGIWACSSILHLSKTELKDVLRKMRNALKKDGIIYTSFKYGQFEGIRNGRYFIDFTEDTFKQFMEEVQGVKLEEFWITGDVRRGRGEEKWLNLILRKSNIV